MELEPLLNHVLVDYNQDIKYIKSSPLATRIESGKYETYREVNKSSYYKPCRNNARYKKLIFDVYFFYHNTAKFISKKIYILDEKIMNIKYVYVDAKDIYVRSYSEATCRIKYICHVA